MKARDSHNPLRANCSADGVLAPLAAEQLPGGADRVTCPTDGVHAPQAAGHPPEGAEEIPVTPIPCCTKCGHEPGTGMCCGDEAAAKRRCARKRKLDGSLAKQVRYTKKEKGCDTCHGPCAEQPQEIEEELEELNRPAGNWRHKKARNAALQEAAVRPRTIPTLEEAVTPAQQKMAALAAKFRK